MLAVGEARPRASQKPHLALGGAAQACCTWGGPTAWRGRPGDSSCKRSARLLPVMPASLSSLAKYRIQRSDSRKLSLRVS